MTERSGDNHHSPRAAGSLILERDSVLGAIDEALDRAVDERGSTVLVAGDAGLGKTTVLEWALARASRPISAICSASSG
jgi:predicted ATP-dependent serine protease